MKKAIAVDPAKPYELPTPAAMPAVDPFALAKQFDQMRQPGFMAPTARPITSMPLAQQGGQPAFQAPMGRGATGGIGNALRGATAGPAAAGGGWGASTATFQAQFPTLRHTSGYRDPEHNARTPGASPTSYHMQRDAEGNSRANDYVGSPKDMQAAAAYAKSNGAKEVLIHNAGTGQHLHIAWS